MNIGVLALQGAFVEHEKVLLKLGVDSFEIRQKKDLNRNMDGLILPGGESTVMGNLLKELDLFNPIKNLIEAKMPVLATCAGLILLADQIQGEATTYLKTLPITVLRNAYGRQLGSFNIKATMRDLGEVDMTFIRAPYVVDVKEGVEVLATVSNHIVAVKYENQIGLSFHPELTKDTTIHKAFLKLCEREKNINTK